MSIITNSDTAHELSGCYKKKRRRNKKKGASNPISIFNIGTFYSVVLVLVLVLVLVRVRVLVRVLGMHLPW